MPYLWIRPREFAVNDRHDIVVEWDVFGGDIRMLDRRDRDLRCEPMIVSKPDAVDPSLFIEGDRDAVCLEPCGVLIHDNPDEIDEGHPPLSAVLTDVDHFIWNETQDHGGGQWDRSEDGGYGEI